MTENGVPEGLRLCLKCKLLFKPKHQDDKSTKCRRCSGNYAKQNQHDKKRAA